MKSFKLTILYILLTLNLHSQTKEIERIAILDFQILTNNKDLETYQWMALGFSESLTDAFSRITQFSVIERSQLEKIIQEQKLQKTESIDTNSIVRIGKVLGVKKVLLGSCQIYTGHVLINMRIANVETGEIAPLDNLPIIASIDSILFLQKNICLEILRQFKAFRGKQDYDNVNIITAKSTKSFKAYEFLVKGIELYNKNQFLDALQMFNTALDYDKKYKKAFYRRGTTNFALNRFELAANDFKKSDKYINRDSVYYLMGNSYLMQGNTKKAMEFFKKAEKINPLNQSARNAIIKIESINNDLTKEQKTEIKEPEVEIPGVIETTYEFNFGIAKVRSKKKFGFIDTLNNLVIPFIYDEIKEFKWGYAAARIGNKWGYINDFAKQVIAPKYSDADDFTKFGLAVVSLDKAEGVINVTDQTIIPFEFNYINLNSYDSLIVVSKYINRESRYGAFDLRGKVILPVQYDSYDRNISSVLNNPSYPYIHLSYNQKWGIVDKENNVIVPFKYSNKECIREFVNGFAAIKVNERWGFVNTKGKEVIAPIYDNVKDFTTTSFEVKLRGKWGLLDSSFTITVPIEYEIIENLKEGKLWAAKKDSYWGIIDNHNKIYCDFKYDKIGPSVTTQYYSITAYIHDYYKNNYLFTPASKNGKIIWINEKGTCVYKCE